MGWHNPPMTWQELERALSGEESPHPIGGTPPGSRPDPGPVSTRRTRSGYRAASRRLE